MDYQEFLSTKRLVFQATGKQVDLFQWAESNKQPEAVPEDIDVYLNDLTNAMRDEGS